MRQWWQLSDALILGPWVWAQGVWLSGAPVLWSMGLLQVPGAGRAQAGSTRRHSVQAWEQVCAGGGWGGGEAQAPLPTACAGAVVVMEDLTVHDALLLPPSWVDAPGSAPRPLALAFAHGQGRMVLQSCTLVVPCAELEGALPQLRLLPGVTVTPAAPQV